MRGVIAAGDPKTAQTGADILRIGGNAVDAGQQAACSPVCYTIQDVTDNDKGVRHQNVIYAHHLSRMKCCSPYEIF